MIKLWKISNKKTWQIKKDNNKKIEIKLYRGKNSWVIKLKKNDEDNPI